MFVIQIPAVICFGISRFETMDTSVEHISRRKMKLSSQSGQISDDTKVNLRR